MNTILKTSSPSIDILFSENLVFVMKKNMSKHLDLAVASLNRPENGINFQLEAESQIDTTLRLVSPYPSCVEDFSLKDTKRNWEDIDGGRVSRCDPLVLGFQSSPSAPKTSKRSSSGAMSIISSAYVAGEECSVNQALNFIPNAPAITPLHALVGKPAFNLESFAGLAVSSITSEAGTPAQRLIKCQFPQCEKRARGASGCCVAHGGGQQCQKADCGRRAEGKTIYCKLHGGGRRCEKLGCLKSAKGGTDFCIGHGGGHRCSRVGCTTASRGKSGLCIKHGGGRRCEKKNCTKSAGVRSYFCVAHGGGKRCHYEGCKKGAQGSTMFCKAHGGGKRCGVEGCGKCAEGSTPFCKRHGGGKRCLFQGGGACSKSVHGRTQFCVAHGGGKRCAAPKCDKSARGRTDYCVRHGGGERCQFAGCDKSAQGRTNFCKVHGSVKWCSWGSQARSDIGSDAASCNRFSTGEVHTALVQDDRVHGGKTMGPPTSHKPAASEKMKVIVEEGSSLFCWNAPEHREFIHPIIPVKPGAISLPEGRVHGGGVMALLAKGDLNPSENQAAGCSSSNQGPSLYYGCS